MNIRKTSTAILILGASAPALATGDAGAGGAALLTPQIGTIFWTVVTFISLLWLLRRFAWGPLIGAVEAREKSIADTIDAAKSDRSEAETLLQQHRDLLAEARRERAEAVEQGRRDAEAVKAEILDEARKQRDHLLKQTEAQLEAGMSQAPVDLAIGAAEKLLAERLD